MFTNRWASNAASALVLALVAQTLGGCSSGRGILPTSQNSQPSAWKTVTLPFYPASTIQSKNSRIPNNVELGGTVGVGYNGSSTATVKVTDNEYGVLGNFDVARTSSTDQYTGTVGSQAISFSAPDPSSISNGTTTLANGVVLTVDAATGTATATRIINGVTYVVSGSENADGTATISVNDSLGDSSTQIVAFTSGSVSSSVRGRSRDITVCKVSQWAAAIGGAVAGLAGAISFFTGGPATPVGLGFAGVAVVGAAIGGVGGLVAYIVC